MAKKKGTNNAPTPAKRKHDPARTAANKARRIFQAARKQQKDAEKRARRAEAARKEQEALAMRTVFIRSMPHEKAVQLEIRDLIKHKEQQDESQAQRQLLLGATNGKALGATDGKA